MTTVVSFHDVREHFNTRAGTWDSPKFVYIGRKNQTYGLPESPWANPFRITRDTKAARTSVLNQYRKWLKTSAQGAKLLERLHELDGKTLVCWCSPQPCHGDILLEMMGEQTVGAAPDYFDSQIGMDGTQPPVLAWDDGGAAYQIGQARNGDLFRTNEKIAHPIGLPGVVYKEWLAWYRDYLKDVLRVRCGTLTMNREEHARFRYEMRLRNMVGVEGNERMNIEAVLLQELLAEVSDEIRQDSHPHMQVIRSDARAMIERDVLREMIAEQDDAE